MDAEQFCMLVNAAFQLNTADIEFYLSHINDDGTLEFDLADDIAWRQDVLKRQGKRRSLPQHVLSVQEKSRASFPLRFQHALQYVDHRVALIGYVSFVH